MARAKIIISAALALGLAACSTVQENPNYQYSTKYQAPSDTSYTSTTPATYTQSAQGQAYQGQTYQGQTYQGGSTAYQAQQDCRRKEGNREIIGGAAGGAIGAFAGKKLIGGTTGTIVGAVAGGAAGYGIGDISVDCSPVAAPAPTQVYQAAPNQVYQAAPTQVYQGAPTDAQYAGQEIAGTPGYEVFQNQGSPVSGGTINPTTVTVSGPVHAASANVPSNLRSQNVATGSVEVTNYDYSENLISADTPIEAQNYPANETRIIGQASSFQNYIVQPGDTVYGLSRKLCVGIPEIQTQNNITANYGINIGQNLKLPQNRC